MAKVREVSSATYADVLKTPLPTKLKPSEIQDLNVFENYLCASNSTFDLDRITRGVNSIARAIGDEDNFIFNNSKETYLHLTNKEASKQSLDETPEEPKDSVQLAKLAILSALNRYVSLIEVPSLRAKVYKQIAQSNADLADDHPAKYSTKLIASTCLWIFTYTKPLICARVFEKRINLDVKTYDPEFIKTSLLGLGMILGIPGQKFSDLVLAKYTERKGLRLPTQARRISDAVSSVLYDLVESIQSDDSKSTVKKHLVFLYFKDATRSSDQEGDYPVSDNLGSSTTSSFLTTTTTTVAQPATLAHPTAASYPVGPIASANCAPLALPASHPVALPKPGSSSLQVLGPSVHATSSSVTFRREHLSKNWLSICRIIHHHTRQLFFNGTLCQELEDHVYSFFDPSDFASLAKALYLGEANIPDRIFASMRLLARNFPHYVFSKSLSESYSIPAASLIAGSGYEITTPEMYLVPYCHGVDTLILPNNDHKLSGLLQVLNLIKTRNPDFKLSNIKTLVLNEWVAQTFGVSRFTLLQLLSFLPEVQSIKVDQCSVLNSMPTFDSVTNLTNLSLSSNMAIAFRDTFNLNTSCASIASRVKKIALTNFKGVQWKTIIFMANRNHLESITVRHTDCALKRLTRCSAHILQNTSLRTLQIHGRWIYFHDLAPFANNMQSLSQLDISGSSLIFRDGPTIPNLKTLIYNEPPFNVEAALPFIFANFPGLEKLFLEDIASDQSRRQRYLTALASLRNIAVNTTLKVLSLDGQHLSLRDAAIVLQKFQGLESLKLSSNSTLIPDDMDVQEALTIGTTFIVSTSLKALNLHGCFIDFTLDRLVTLMSAMPHLEQLVISNNKVLFTDYGNLKIRLGDESKDSLKVLNVDGLALSNGNLEALLRTFANLEELEAVGATVTDLEPLSKEFIFEQPVQNMIANGSGKDLRPTKPHKASKETKLKKINLNGSSVTYWGLYRLLLISPKLESISAKFLVDNTGERKTLSKLELRLLRQAFPKVKILV